MNKAKPTLWDEMDMSSPQEKGMEFKLQLGLLERVE